MDLLLWNGVTREGRRVDVRVTDGQIAAVEPAGEGVADGAATVELDGSLLLPPLAEPHAHIDKALTAERMPNPAGDLLGAIDAWLARANEITHDDIVERATGALERLVTHGTTAVRTHVNVIGGAESVAAICEVRDSFAGVLDLQIAALPTCPLTGSEGAGNRAALAAGLEAGADLVGGCPHLDPDPVGLIEVALAAATDAGVGMDLHVDETLDAEMLSLADLARAVQAHGFPHPVAASHCVSLGMQPADVQREVAAQVAAAGIAVVALPQTNLGLQGRDHPTATPRGLTAVRPLTDAGVLVAAGADNVQDPFNLVGRSDPLETASLMVMAGHCSPDEAFRMVSANPRAVMGLPPADLTVGDVADLVTIDAGSVRAAIADAPLTRSVYKQGRLVAETTVQSTLLRR